jgi:hypothetical protein
MYVLLIVACPFVPFLLAIVLSVLLQFTDSDYPFGIFKLFLVLYVCFVDHCLSFCTFSFGHCVVCSSLIYGF